MAGPEVIAWRHDELQIIMERVAAALRAGQLVALPTEAGYEVAASALHDAAVADLIALAGADQTPTVVLSEANEVFDWLPHFRGAALRLARAYWPGPVTLVGAGGARHGLASRLPAAVRQRLTASGRLALRLPDQHWPAPLRRQLAAPILAAPLPGAPGHVDDIRRGMDQLGLILDAGACPMTGLPSIIEAVGNSLVVVREGAVPRADVDVVAPCRILFLCTGNTCRSPLAEALCKRLLAGRLRCDVAELPIRGFVVQSAGMAAGPGNPATPEAAAVVADQYGGDLAGHRSQPVSLDLLSRADLVFTMTWSHLSLLRSLRVPVGPTPTLLDPSGADIDDPIGGSPEVYQACAARIWSCLNERLPQLLEA